MAVKLLSILTTLAHKLFSSSIRTSIIRLSVLSLVLVRLSLVLRFPFFLGFFLFLPLFPINITYNFLILLLSLLSRSDS